MKLLVALLAFSSFALAQPLVGGCPIFPSTNIWNVPVDTLAVHPNSTNIITSVGTLSGLRFVNMIPINTAPAGTAKVAMSTSNTESDLGPWPMPSSPQVEAGPNNHLIVIDQGTCILYEAFFAVQAANGTWTASSIAKWDLRSNALRPNGWTSADGAGLSITAGILRYDEVAAGEVKHALRVAVPATYGNTYTWPARHYASHLTDTNLPKMGQRFRLNASFNITAFTSSPQLQVILRGLQKYGMLVAENGTAWDMQHDQNPGWSSINLAALNSVLGSSMEVVDASALMTDVDSGVAVVPPPPGLLMTDQLGRKNSVPLGSGLSLDNVTGTIVASSGTSAVTSVAGRTGAVTLGMGDILNLNTTLAGVNTALSGKQPLLSFTPEQVLNFSGPLTRSGNTISCTTCVTSSSTSARSGTATFVPNTITSGSWKGVVGNDGYQIVGDATKMPVYAALTALGNQTVTWANSTNDNRALQKAGNGRVAAAWYTPNGMTIEINIADGLTHKVSLYLVDWDHLGRKLQVDITDLEGNPLDPTNPTTNPRIISNFDNGQYLQWNISGRVIIRLTNKASNPTVATAVVSGIFFE